MAIRKPATPTKRTLNALETKKKIFEKSIELFKEYGFDTVTIGDITSELDLSKGTFYVHFPSKESILIEQFRQIDAHYNEIYDLLPEDTSAVDAVLALMKGMCEYCANHVGLPLMQVIYANQATASRASLILTGDDRTIYILLDEIYAKGLSSGEFCSVPEGMRFSDIIMRSARALIYDWCLCDGAFELEAEGSRHFQLVLKLFMK